MEATGKYDFAGTAADELSFRKGDIIKILGTNDDWFKAEVNGMEGFVPRNYININFPSWYQENTSRHENDVQHFKVMRDRHGQYYLWSETFSSLNRLVEFYTHNSISKQSCVYLLTEQRNTSDFLHRKSAEPPPISQERHNYRTPAPAYPRPPEPSPPPHRKSASALQVRAMYDFTAEDADELNFHAGDIIEVLDQSDRFWWKGVLRGRNGLFPVNYTNPV
uniref:Osteoclast-stimulating factor 1 n=1 Tax=Sinocyclocheilus rhinocerous TaxID=307959 RepID=A0A673MCC1_9TELE